ncbi:NAD(P)-dependent oxidoreductase [Ciceribacter ferrooxidans]|uniref:precorrin-2 dehydrogenase n=1 Tax=Ciceribacter ferrooxidans TaxID=2509717 RepID=A0A4Q2T9Y6_9HYPH|nr:NAD(P)-dependent oxidoreductase [Ciceribacter ferrooxidans]RYC15737.1 siroheme synthase [Ciceribacter ferrooxidans]
MPRRRLQQSEEGCRGRIAPLAALPVFWELRGRRVIVAGGSAGAAWKAELLAAAGAEVHVFADEEQMSEAMRELPGSLEHRPASRIIHHPRAWTPDSFAGMALAIADCADETEAEAFCHAADAMGVPANVIDRPAFCRFRFGSIVNRSPVIVSISTDGAAPILAQAIRRRIETLLPLTLGAWTVIAQKIRERLNERLLSGPLRRVFWEGFVDRALAGGKPPEEGMAAALLNEADTLAAEPSGGHLAFVGAHPSDPELLTLKAVRALQSADVIFFDDDVAGGVLELARREAGRVPLAMGRGGTPVLPDEALTLAVAGKRVVRLCSSDLVDPTCEAAQAGWLRKRGVTVEAIPGVATTGQEVGWFGANHNVAYGTLQLRA